MLVKRQAFKQLVVAAGMQARMLAARSAVLVTQKARPGFDWEGLSLVKIRKTKALYRYICAIMERILFWRGRECLRACHFPAGQQYWAVNLESM